MEYGVKKAEHHFINARPLPVVTTIESVCFDHDSLQSKVTPSNLVSSTCSTATQFITRFSCGLEVRERFVPNTMLLVLAMFRTRLLLATHSKTDCNSLLRVSVTSLSVVADTYMVDSSAYMDTQALFNANGRWLVKNRNE